MAQRLMEAGAVILLIACITFGHTLPCTVAFCSKGQDVDTQFCSSSSSTDPSSSEFPLIGTLPDPSLYKFLSLSRNDTTADVHSAYSNRVLGWWHRELAAASSAAQAREAARTAVQVLLLNVQPLRNKCEEKATIIFAASCTCRCRSCQRM